MKQHTSGAVVLPGADVIAVEFFEIVASDVVPDFVLGEDVFDGFMSGTDELEAILETFEYRAVSSRIRLVF